MTLPLDRRTLAVLRWPELGFFGFVTPTFRQTPFISGRFCEASAGDTACRAFLGCRPCVRTWFSVMQRLGVVEKERDVALRRIEELGREGLERGRRTMTRNARSAEREGTGGIVSLESNREKVLWEKARDGETNVVCC